MSELAKRAALELLAGSDADAREVKSALVGAANGGDVEAQNLLGAIELEIERKPRRARRWFEMSAAAGDPAGQRSLRHLYANGLGVKADIARAVDLFRAAAAGGDAFACYNLAAANTQAEGAYCTFEETLELLGSAAEGGVVEAAATLGDLLGRVDRDTEALRWYVWAAERGHFGAMNAAACWFRDGTAGEADSVQALRWFLAPFAHNRADGLHEAIKLAKTMSVEQIRQAALLSGRIDEGETLIRSTRQ